MSAKSIRLEDLDAETRALIGFPDQQATEPISDRLVILGRVLALLKGFSMANSVWILSQALYAVQREMANGLEADDISDGVPPAGFIIYTVAKAFDLEVTDLLARSRWSEIVEARQTAMFILWNTEGYTLRKIGQALGGRSAATVSHGFQNIASRLSRDSQLRRKVEIINNTLRKGEVSESDYLLWDGK